MEPINLALEIDPDADLSEVTLGLLLERLAHLQPVLDQAADVMARYQKENFSDQGQTFGAPWQENAASTRRQKAKDGFPDRTLVRSGNLENEVGQMWVFGQDSVSVGIDLDQAPEAMFAQPESLGGGNKGGRTPARVLVSVTQEEVEEIERVVQTMLDEIPGVPPGAVRVVLL